MSDILPPDDEADAVLSACALHKTLYRLAHAREWRLAHATVEEWVGDVERLVSTGGARA